MKKGGDLFLIGCGAGFSGDRTDAAIPVVKSLSRAQLPAAIFFETLGERTLALGQVRKQKDPTQGYEPLLAEFIKPILRDCVRFNIPVIGNFGAANPPAAAHLIKEIAYEQGLNNLKIAVIEGDDITDSLDIENMPIWEGDDSIKLGKTKLISANAYLGARPVTEALKAGADVVVAGRLADPALALGPIMAHYDWSWDDWDILAQLTLAGHLLECGAQVTGGYFADPGCKEVKDLARVGFPIAEIREDASFVITKAEPTGGMVSLATVKEQLLYEVHDPANYITPDVILDITGVKLTELGPNRVLVQGAKGRARPDQLKVTAGFTGEWLGEGEISYAGPNAKGRALLAADVIKERLKMRQIEVNLRFDLIGLSSVFDNQSGDLLVDQGSGDIKVEDIRLRMAVSAPNRSDVDKALQELSALYCTGPAAGGGIRTQVRNRIHTRSYMIPRAQVESRFYFI